MDNVRNLHTIKSDYSEGFRAVEYTDTTSKDPWDTRLCLGDYNIGTHHNRHYLFHLREDAEAYLKWAKVNTPNMRNVYYSDYKF